MIAYKKEIVQKLIDAAIEPCEASSEADLLIEFVSGKTKKDFLINSHLKLSEDQENRLIELVKQRCEKKIPVQYLMKKAYFMGDEFYVDENVLIPRDETEILVNEAFELAKEIKSSPVKIVDIGTGSGCIPVMLCKKLIEADIDFEISAVDISKEALDVARINAEERKVLNKINFVQSDLFENVGGFFDLIVSNPPYIPISEKNNIQVEVNQHEPHLALYANDKDGVAVYSKIIEQAKVKLEKNGKMAFELGVGQAKIVSDLLERNGFGVRKIVEDLEGIERVILAEFNGC